MVAVLMDTDHQIRLCLFDQLAALFHIRHFFMSIFAGIQPGIHISGKYHLYIRSLQIRFQLFSHCQINIFFQLTIDPYFSGICAPVSRINYNNFAIFSFNIFIFFFHFNCSYLIHVAGYYCH